MTDDLPQQAKDIAGEYVMNLHKLSKKHSNELWELTCDMIEKSKHIVKFDKAGHMEGYLSVLDLYVQELKLNAQKDAALFIAGEN